MKKIASIAAIVVFAVGFTSCKKEYDCTCKGKIAIMTDNDTTIVQTLPKAKKKDARAACDAKETLYKLLDPAANCDI